MKDLILKIEKWAHDRNIINGSTTEKQAVKLFEEKDELDDNIHDGKSTIDDIGDIFVVLTNLTKQLGHSLSDLDFDKLKWADSSNEQLSEILGYSLYDFVELANFGHFSVGIAKRCINILNALARNNGNTLEECVAFSYDEIKDRVGILWDGIFVKSTDDRYPEVKDMYEKSLEENYRA